MKILISKKSIRAVILIFLVVMMEGIFYFVDAPNVNLFGVITYNYIWLSLFLVFVAYTYFRHQLWKCKVTYHFGKEIAFLLVLVFVQALRGCITYGQSFMAGFEQQGCYFFLLLGYYPIRVFYSRHIIDDRAIDKSLLVFGVAAFTIYFTQILLGESTLFLHLHTAERYGSLRMYIDSILCVIIGFYGMDRFLRTRKWRSLILVALTVTSELFISKGRLEFAAFCASIAIGLVLMKKYNVKKTFTIGIAICLVFAFLSDPYVNEKFIEAIDNLINNTGTMQGRNYGRELYAARLMNSVGTIIFGYGYPVSDAALNMSGNSESIYLADNGIFAFAYVYGILGVAAVILWFAKMLRMSWRLYRKQNEYIYFMFIVFNIGLMYNITFWWWKYAWTLVLVIMMCKMEYHLHDKPREENMAQIKRFNAGNSRCRNTRYGRRMAD